MGDGITTFNWGNYVQAVGLLFLLLALLWFVVKFMRRFGHFSFMPRAGALPREALFMEAQMPLGPRKGLMVVRFFDRRLLLGVTDQQITLLTEERANHDSTDQDFQQVMDKAEQDATLHRHSVASSSTSIV